MGIAHPNSRACGDKTVEYAAAFKKSGPHGIEVGIPFQKPVEVEPGADGVAETEAARLEHRLRRLKNLPGLVFTGRCQPGRDHRTEPAEPGRVVLIDEPHARPIPNERLGLHPGKRKRLQGWGLAVIAGIPLEP